MKNNIIVKYKIYAFVLGIVIGTLIYNIGGIDFYYYKKMKIVDINLFQFAIVLLVTNIKFCLLILVISTIKIKNVFLFCIIFKECICIVGNIYIVICCLNPIFLIEIPLLLSKIVFSSIVIEGKISFKNLIKALGVLVGGNLIELMMIIVFNKI